MLYCVYDVHFYISIHESVCFVCLNGIYDSMAYSLIWNVGSRFHDKQLNRPPYDVAMWLYVAQRHAHITNSAVCVVSSPPTHILYHQEEINEAYDIKVPKSKPPQPCFIRHPCRISIYTNLPRCT